MDGILKEIYERPRKKMKSGFVAKGPGGTVVTGSKSKTETPEFRRNAIARRIAKMGKANNKENKPNA